MSFARYPSYKDSGVEWLGQVPAHWKTSRLRYVCECLDGGRIPLNSSQRADKQGNIPYWGANSIVGYVDEALFDEELVLLGEDGAPFFDNTKPVAFFSQGKVWPNNHVHVLRPSSEGDSKFITYVLNITDYTQFIDGSTRDKLTQGSMNDIPLPWPTRYEQSQIAAFLDRETAKIDALVAEQRRLMTLLKEKRQALVSHAVTRGLNPDAPMKPSGIEWLGDVPEHWEVKPMRMIANIVRGASPRPAGDPRYFGGDAVPWVTVGEITKDDEVYLTETKSFLTQEGATHSNLFKSDTLIYSNSGATLGVPKVLRIDACANDGVVAFTNLDNRVQVEFLYHYLASITDSIREKVKQGSGQPNLNTDIVKDLRFGLPPSAEQKLIVARITQLANEFGALTTEAQRAIDLLQERRTALISAAVTGQIDVRSAVISALLHPQTADNKRAQDYHP